MNTLIIAEAGVNHCGKLYMAFDLIDAAKECGADIVKFQSYQTDRLVVEGHEDLEMLKELELPLSAFQELYDYSKKADIGFLVSVFNEEAVDPSYPWLEDYIKVPSGEITNLPLLEHIGRTLYSYKEESGKPAIYSGPGVFLSTGMSTLAEVDEAVRALENEARWSCVQYLLHCTSAYPTDPRDSNLLAMDVLRAAFPWCYVGLSDHSLSPEIPIAAVAMGAEVIEKHLTFNRNLAGPDHKASLEPKEFKKMVESVKLVEEAMGDGRKGPRESERETMRRSRKKIVAQVDIRKGEVVEGEMVRMVRTVG